MKKAQNGHLGVKTGDKTDLLLKKVGYPGPLLLGDCGQDPVCSAEVSSHDSCLILQHRQQQRIADDVQLFVSKVESAIFWDVAQEIHYPKAKKTT